MCEDRCTEKRGFRLAPEPNQPAWRQSQTRYVIIKQYPPSSLSQPAPGEVESPSRPDRRAIRRLLGSSPCLHGLRDWLFAVLSAVAAWHVYNLFPISGLIAIGVAPFATMYFFFKGLSGMSRALPYWKTRLRAQRLGLVPTWGSAAGGFVLVDLEQGLWVANGVFGTFTALSRLACRSNGQAFRLELFLEPDDTVPAASVGLSGPEELLTAARIFQNAVTRARGNPIPLEQIEE